MKREDYLKLCREVATHSRDWFIDCYHNPSALMVKSTFGMEVMKEVMIEIGAEV